MLRNATELFGYTVRGTDGEFGSVHDFFFDDHAWSVRYLVVDTGNWLPGRKALIVPAAMGSPDWDAEIFPVLLTQEQIEAAPGIAHDRPVSRQAEIDLHNFYGWAPYWTTVGRPLAVPGAVPRPVHPVDPAPETTGEPVRQGDVREYDPHLRSMREVTGYHIEARDGEIGHVEDFIIDDNTWWIQYLVIDTRNWLPGRKVLTALEWVTEVDWPEHAVRVELSKETIRNSPQYEPGQPLDRQYEAELYDYYGRPYYW